jgi:flavorubredoxin
MVLSIMTKYKGMDVGEVSAVLGLILFAAGGSSDTSSIDSSKGTQSGFTINGYLVESGADLLLVDLTNADLFQERLA